jgi:hypothetical protein
LSRLPAQQLPLRSLLQSEYQGMPQTTHWTALLQQQAPSFQALHVLLLLLVVLLLSLCIPLLQLKPLLHLLHRTLLLKQPQLPPLLLQLSWLLPSSQTCSSP